MKPEGSPVCAGEVVLDEITFVAVPTPADLDVVMLELLPVLIVLLSW